MNRRTEMGGVRVERTQYRRWGGNKKKEVDGGRLENQNGARRITIPAWREEPERCEGVLEND